MRAQHILDKFTMRLADVFRGRAECSATNLPHSGQALIAWAVQRAHGKPVVWIADGPQSLEMVHQDMASLAPGNTDPQSVLLYYPALESFPTSELTPDIDIAAHRLTVLVRLLQHDTLTDAPAPIIATSIQALMQKTMSPATMRGHMLTIRVGDEIELDAATRTLADSGHGFTIQIDEKGQVAVRGGLLDVWPVTETWPTRIEFVGSVIDTIRTFDPTDQKSIARLDHVVIPPVGDWSPPGRTMPGNRVSHDMNRSTEIDVARMGCVLSYIPGDAVFVWSDVEGIRHHASTYKGIVEESQQGSNLTISHATLRSLITRKKSSSQVFIGDTSESAAERVELDMMPIDGVFDMPRGLLQPDLMEKQRQTLIEDLRNRAAQGQNVLMYFDTEGALDHFKDQLANTSQVWSEVGIVSGGFVSASMGLVIVSESDLYGRKKMLMHRYQPLPAARQPNRIATRISDLAEIEPGDLVVHAEHGLGRYMGLREIMFSDQMQEVLTVEYADNARLHVPVSHAHLLSRYVGVPSHQAHLHRLGGSRWSKDKAAAELAIADLAASLLETQAQRTLLPGHAFPVDLQWEREFEASFPYRETRDQVRVIAEVKADMESSRPMDRLVCGDAGYGKTEVAMRAAFKTVMAEKQVAVLVPTTVLAQQHYETFKERMAAYPVRVDMLSRFCTRSMHTRIVAGLAEGTVDIVIGTHALIQPSIRFRDLGLVVIDEEQRFGVVHKESFKDMRRLVDVLTMTATPIPRTLYMSLMGSRDMSLLQTPPGERMAIETIVTRNADNIIREAVLREIGRDGQVFYLHNRVRTIELVRSRLKRLLPEVRIEIAHGQMASSELASVMRSFATGQVDVLLCTTIVESGMDIPRANTILIDRADRFGIADLYQLRGRVGRSNRKAYAYLLLPARGLVDSDAQKRIGAVKKYSNLSAGFNLALRDLEIRGAGNMLGSKQSGHIAAIGFELYCQLLKRTVARLKGEPVPPIIDVDVRLDFLDLSPHPQSSDSSAIIPYPYIEDEGLRVGMYKKVAEAASILEVAELRSEMADRFGCVPPEVERLLKIAELRTVCAERDIQRVESREGKVMMVRNNDYIKKGTMFPRLTSTTADDRIDEIIRIAKG